MDDPLVREEADDLILWASCILAAMRFPPLLGKPFLRGAEDAVGLFASGILGMLQTREYLDAVRKIGYERRLAQFVRTMHELDPVVDFGALASRMSRAESSAEALEAKSAMEAQIAEMTSPDRRRLLDAFDDFSATERGAFLGIAKETLEELRRFAASHRSLAIETGMDSAALYMERRIREEEGEEPGGNVTAWQPEGPTPRGPLMGRNPLPSGGDTPDPEAAFRARSRERELAGVAGMAATKAA